MRRRRAPGSPRSRPGTARCCRCTPIRLPLHEVGSSAGQVVRQHRRRRAASTPGRRCLGGSSGRAGDRLQLGAASATVRAIGPAVSCEAEIGTMPYRRTRPTVGRRPTRPCARRRADDRARGLGADREHRRAPAAAAAPEPDDEPLGFWSASMRVEHLAAEVGVAARRAVGRRSSRTRSGRLAEDHDAGRAQLGDDRESSVGNECSSATLPAVVGMPVTSRRSLTRTGRPCSGPRSWPVARSMSSSAASVSASGLSEPDGVEPGPALVERRDPVDVGARQLDARELARGHLRLQLGDGQALEVERRRPRRRAAASSRTVRATIRPRMPRE